MSIDYTDTLGYELEVFEGRDVPVRQAPSLSLVLHMKDRGLRPCLVCHGAGGEWPYIDGQECGPCNASGWVKFTSTTSRETGT